MLLPKYILIFWCMCRFFCGVLYFPLRPIIQTVVFQIWSEIATVVFILTTNYKNCVHHCPTEECENVPCGNHILVGMGHFLLITPKGNIIWALSFTMVLRKI